MNKQVSTLDEAIRLSGLKNGMTVSFHHHLRNGDYVLNMVMDRIAACKTYQKEKYTDGSALAYLEKSAVRDLLHPQTRQELTYLLTMLRDEGEKKTFDYIKHHVLKDKPFPWEE